MKNIILAVMILAAASAPLRAAAPDTLSVRAVAWDASWKPASDEAWAERVVAAVAAAVKDGADAIVFPEGFSAGRPLDGILDGVKQAAGADRLVVLGNVIRPEADHAASRAYVLSGGAWTPFDKLDTTPAERAAKVRAGQRLILFRFRGGLAAALPAYSVEKPEIAFSLKKRGVQLVLVSAPTMDAAGRERLERTASARAVELGAAVVIAYPSGEPSVYLPAQSGFGAKPAASAGRTVRVPWRKLLELRELPVGSLEPRPFLDPSPPYQIEI